MHFKDFGSNLVQQGQTSQTKQTQLKTLGARENKDLVGKMTW